MSNKRFFCVCVKTGANATTPSRWIGSISHEDILKLTDLGDALEESDDDDEVDEGRNDVPVADSGIIKRNEMDDDSSDEEEQTFVGWGTPSVPKSPLRSNVVKKGTNRIATTVPEPSSQYGLFPF